MKFRALRLGLMTVLGFARRGFFIPHRYAGHLPHPGANAPYEPIHRHLADREATFRHILSLAEAFGDDLNGIGTEPAPAPRWEQNWFPRLDAAILYTLLRHERPSRVSRWGQATPHASSPGPFPTAGSRVPSLRSIQARALRCTVSTSGF